VKLLLTILIILLISGCATIEKKQAELPNDVAVYYCEECELYFAFNNPYGYSKRDTIVFTPVECPLCGKELVRRRPEGEHLIVVEESYNWICGTPFLNPKRKAR